MAEDGAKRNDSAEAEAFTDARVRDVYRTLGLSGPGMVVVVIPVDKDGFLPLGQAVFMGGEEDLQDLAAPVAGLYDKGYSVFLPDWFRELAGLPPLVEGCSPEVQENGNDEAAGDTDGGRQPP